MQATVCDTIADITQNAFESGATETELVWRRRGNRLEVTVRDNGRGMDEATLRRAMDPFWTEPGKHPGRKVGLGLPFLQQQAETCGGEMKIESQPGQGTTVRFQFDMANVDAPPVGDAAETLTGLTAWPGEREFTVRREMDGRTYEVRRSDLAAAVGGLETAGALALVKEFFRANEAELAGPGDRLAPKN